MLSIRSSIFVFSFCFVSGCDAVSGLDAASVGQSDSLSERNNVQSHPNERSSFAVDSQTLSDLAFVSDASPRAKPEILRGLARSDKPLTRYGIDRTDTHLLHFLSQSATETFGFRTLVESTNYSASRLLDVFPSRVTSSQAQQLHRKPQAIANHVYCGRLGNQCGTDDGWKFRGSGYLQLTGRANFVAIGDRLGKAIEKNPDLVRQPILGLDTALEYWAWRDVGRIADNGTIVQVRRAINGGTNGLSETRVWFEVLKNALEARDGIRVESGRRGVDPIDDAVAQVLGDLGFLEGPVLESTFRSGRYSQALEEFQRSRGLEPTGEFNEETLYAITDPYGLFEEQ